jgi:hypothetical protein
MTGPVSQHRLKAALVGHVDFIIENKEVEKWLKAE